VPVGDFAQVIVAIDVPSGEAGARAERAVDWLVRSAIVERELSDCALGVPGHAPASGFEDACVTEAHDDTSSTPRLRTNGMAVHVGRTVFDTGDNGVELLCEHCAHRFEPDVESWQDAVGAWWQGDDDATYRCPSCAFEQRLAEWDGPWAWAFGQLGFAFWNWPQIRPEFVEALAAAVDSRVRVVRCSR
jgi:hypothetical protein